MSENINDISKITKKASQLQFPELEQKLNKTWKENFFFVQAADTQFGLIDHWGEVPVEEQKWNEDIRLTRLAIKHTNSLEPRPKFFIVCGDMINAGIFIFSVDINVNFIFFFLSFYFRLS